MNLLLDTHALLWAARDDKRKLSSKASKLLSDTGNGRYVSAVSAWEIAMKCRLGKLVEARELVSEFDLLLTKAGYRMLSVSCEHGLLAGGFPQAHRDPFDRLLAAQCLVDKMVLLSADKDLDAFGVTRIW